MTVDIEPKMIAQGNGHWTQSLGIVTRDEIVPAGSSTHEILIRRQTTIENNTAGIHKSRVTGGSLSTLGILLQGERDDLDGEHVVDDNPPLKLTTGQQRYLEAFGEGFDQ